MSDKKQAQSDSQMGSTSLLRRSLKGEADAKRSFAEMVADKLTLGFGSMVFLVVNVIWFIAWIAVNVGLLPFIKAFDPFPFSFLTMVVSLEAIALAIIVLISQNRAARIADLREEVDLQVDLLTESELTKLLQLVTRLAAAQGIDVSGDTELQEMMKPSDPKKIEEALTEDINNG